MICAPTTVSPAAAGAIAPARTYAIGSNASGYANLRQGPGLGWTILAQIPQGTKGIQQTGDCVPSDDGKTRDRWCPVTWNGYRGHVSLTNLQAEDQSVTTGSEDSTTFTVSSNPSGYANMRRGPGLGWEVVTKIPEGTQGLRPAGTCVASDDGSTRDRWCPVSWNGFNGHVSMTNLMNAQAKSAGASSGRTYTIGTNSLGFANMRQGPGLGWPVVSQIPKGARDVRQRGDCVASDDGITKDRWCLVTWGSYTGHVSATNLQD